MLCFTACCAAPKWPKINSRSFKVQLKGWLELNRFNSRHPDLGESLLNINIPFRQHTDTTRRGSVSSDGPERGKSPNPQNRRCPSKRPPTPRSQAYFQPTSFLFFPGMLWLRSAWPQFIHTQGRVITQPARLNGSFNIMSQLNFISTGNMWHDGWKIPRKNCSSSTREYNGYPVLANNFFFLSNVSVYATSTYLCMSSLASQALTC